MLAQEIIRRQRDGSGLDQPQIEQFVTGLVDGGWSDAQVAAMAMAIVLRGLSAQEALWLTEAMTRSGESLHWADACLPGPVLDKHSTGGVGDKVSLVLAPVIAACGGYVPMLSGRGLGHTGGTLDTLESIPGYRTTPDVAGLRAALASAGCAIVGAGAGLAPADRRLYAVRDVTGTVESISLITASILSKKLAAGLGALILDVKCGDGAFMKHAPDAQAARHIAAKLYRSIRADHEWGQRFDPEPQLRSFLLADTGLYNNPGGFELLDVARDYDDVCAAFGEHLCDFAAHAV
mgnify:CR=1 FL=1